MNFETCGDRCRLFDWIFSVRVGIVILGCVITILITPAKKRSAQVVWTHYHPTEEECCCGHSTDCQSQGIPDLLATLVHSPHWCGLCTRVTRRSSRTTDRDQSRSPPIITGGTCVLRRPNTYNLPVLLRGPHSPTSDDRQQQQVNNEKLHFGLFCFRLKKSSRSKGLRTMCVWCFCCSFKPALYTARTHTHAHTSF